MNALVSFVIATYGRPDALQATLTALVQQQHAQWEAIVVGDCCDDETEAAIRSLQDPRISYYNLPERFGEQSGPNSFGLQLARGEFVCFLNHDDLLLPDHLAYTLSEMERRGADFFFGRYARATTFSAAAQGGLPVFDTLLPVVDDMALLFAPGRLGLDPSSFWLVRTALARAVGPWRPAAQLWRTPLADWLLRAARLRPRFAFGSRVTGLRMLTHYARKAVDPLRPAYQHASPEYARLIEHISNQEPEILRRALIVGYGQPAAAPALGAARRSAAAVKRLLLGLAWLVYRRMGVDLYVWACRLRGIEKGRYLRALARRRIGEELGQIDLQRLLQLDPQQLRRL